MSRQAVLFFLLALLLPTAASAQDASARADATKRFERLVERLEELAAEHHAPGMGLAVVTPDGVFLRGIGLADLDTNRKVTPDTVFEIGSTTKTFTSVVTAMLVDEGLMSFDDRVRKHVENFRLMDEDANEQVNLRDVLSHRTGLARTDLLLGEGLGVNDVVEQLGECEQLAPFRQSFLYNNQMFLVAGLAAQSAAETEYADLIRERIFEPLRMSASTVRLSEGLEMKPSNGFQWLPKEDRHKVLPHIGIGLSEPAGSIWSTPRDMAKYLSFLLSRGATADGDALLSKERFDEDLWTSHMAMGPNAGYGLGFMLGEWREKKLVNHGGNIDGFTSQMALLPDEGIAFSLLVNTSLSPMQAASTEVVFETMLGLEPVAAPDSAEPLGTVVEPEALEAYVGDFDFKLAGQTWTTSILESGKLALDVPGQMVYELNWPDDEGKWAFTLAPDQIQVSFLLEGETVSSITLHQAGQQIEMPRKTLEGLPELDEVLAKMTAATSMEELVKLCPLRMHGEVRLPNQGLTGSWLFTYQDETHFRTDMDFGKFGQIISTVGGDQGWSYTGIQGHQEMSAMERAEAAQSLSFSTPGDHPEDFDSMRVLGVEGEGGDTVWLLKVTPKLGNPSVMHVHAATGLTREIDGAISLGEVGGLPVNTKLDDYEEHHGIQFPKTTRSRNPATGGSVVTLIRVETHVTIPESLWTER